MDKAVIQKGATYYTENADGTFSQPKVAEEAIEVEVVFFSFTGFSAFKDAAGNVYFTNIEDNKA